MFKGGEMCAIRGKHCAEEMGDKCDCEYYAACVSV